VILPQLGSESNLRRLDLAFKKAPPAGYPYPPVDLVEAVTRVVRNLQNNTYQNELAWQSDLFNTFNNAKDGHL
jgi:hypothetical protein